MPERNKRTIYYSDPIHDDFAENQIHTQPVGKTFPFVHESKLWNLLAALLYYGIAIPLVFLITKVYLGLKFENRAVLRQLRDRGYFLYGNHTRALDGMVPSMAAFPQRAYVVANPDAVSIPLLKNVVLMLGCIPIPNAFSGMGKFLEAVELRCRQKRCVAIFPEAHIWPFYTGVRPFGDTSFHYPVKENAPAVAMVTTYRRRSGLFRFCRRPGMTVVLSQPMYPDPTLPPKQAQQELRQRVYQFMEENARSHENVEWVHYEYRPNQ